MCCCHLVLNWDTCRAQRAGLEGCRSLALTGNGVGGRVPGPGQLFHASESILYTQHPREAPPPAEWGKTHNHTKQDRCGRSFVHPWGAARLENLWHQLRRPHCLPGPGFHPMDCKELLKLPGWVSILHTPQRRPLLQETPGRG